VVSGPGKDYLFLLAREPNPSSAVREQMLAAAQAAGLPVERLIYRP
jgi:lipocalin